MRRLALLGLCALAACEEDRSPDRPGPPSIRHAYMVEATYLEDGTASYLDLLRDPTFDPTDGALWRRIPDLNGAGSTAPYVPSTLLRAVLTELIEGELVEDIDAMGQATLKPEVITVTATPRDPMAMPSAAAASPPQDSYFDPTGTHDTGPPGPALVMAPRPVLPSASTVFVTFRAAAIRDVGGLPMESDVTFFFETAPLGVLLVNGDVLGADPVEVPTEGVITLGFNTLLDPATALAVELHEGDATGPLVPATVAIDAEVADAVGGAPAVSLQPMAPLGAGRRYAAVVRSTVTDLYAMPAPGDLVVPLVTP